MKTFNFNEITLSASLQYSEKLDKVIGFKDLGSLNCLSKFVHKALVFLRLEVVKNSNNQLLIKKLQKIVLVLLH